MVCGPKPVIKPKYIWDALSLILPPHLGRQEKFIKSTKWSEKLVAFGSGPILFKIYIWVSLVFCLCFWQWEWKISLTILSFFFFCCLTSMESLSQTAKTGQHCWITQPCMLIARKVLEIYIVGYKIMTLLFINGSWCHVWIWSICQPNYLEQKKKIFNMKYYTSQGS